MKNIFFSALLVALGAFLWWAFSPLLFDKEVNDQLDPTLEARLEAQRQFDQNRQPQPSSNEDESTAQVETASEIDASVQTSAPVDLPQTFVEGPFPIMDTPSHPASGVVEVIYSPEERLLRYKNYNGTNGPDLKIYLATDLDAKQFVNLGDAKGNKGDIIYGIPLDVDLDDYKYVLTWCEAFGVLFDYAEIK